MTVKELSEKLGLTAISGLGGESREVKGCYIGDLLSLVMSRASAGDAWITIQGNINVPAVASLTDCAMVIIAEDIKLEDVAAAKFENEDIPVYSSAKSAYELAAEISKCL